MKRTPLKSIVALFLVVALMSANCGALAGTLKLPKNLVTIPDEAFAGDRALDKVEVPWGAVQIGSKAFANSGVAEIYIPDTVGFISGDAFDGTKVTIRSSDDAYAAKYASAHGLAWKDSDDDGPRDAQQIIDETEEGSLSLSDMDMEALEAVSLDAAEDAKEREVFKAYNSMLAEQNRQLAEYNKKLSALREGVQGLSDNLSKTSAVKSRGVVDLDLFGLQLRADEDIWSEDSELPGMTGNDFSTEDGNIVLSSDAGDIYMYMSGTTVVLTRQKPKNANGALYASDVEQAVDAAVGFATSLLDVKLEKSLEGVMDAAATAMDNSRKRLEALKGWENKLHSKKALDRLDQIKTKENDNYKKLVSRNNRLNLFKGLMGALNIGQMIADLYEIRNNWITVTNISDHGHPTGLDLTYPEGTEDSQQLKEDIISLRILYVTHAVTTLIKLVDACATICTASTGVGVPATFMTYAAAVALDGVERFLGYQEDMLFERIKDTDKRLHTYVYGRVTDAATGKPLSKVGVTDGALAAITDDNGYYELHLKPESTALAYNLKGYGKGELPITPKVGEAIEGNIKLEEDDNVVFFGHYDQDNNPGNGKEPIEWIVLSRKGKTVTLLSRYGLLAHPYHFGYVDTTWEECSIRGWLNGEFLNEAFTAEEQAQIQRVFVSAVANPTYDSKPGNSTYDKVYLLNIFEAQQLPLDIRLCEPTETAVASGAVQGNCYWWLRTPGHMNVDAVFVLSDGTVHVWGIGVENAESVARPVICVELP